jgi:hypothetical protein
MFRPTTLLSGILASVVSLAPVARLDAQMLDIILTVGSSDLNLFNYFQRVARARLKVTRATPEQLARAKLRIARQAYEMEARQFEVGKKEVTVEVVGASSKRWLDSERAVHPGREEQVAALERHWLRAKQAEDIATAKFEAKVFDETQFSPVRYDRLEAESELARVKGRHKDARGWEAETHNTLFLKDPLHAGNGIAKALWEFSGPNPEALAPAKLAVARAQYHARAKQFFVGKAAATSEFVLDAARRLLESELALSRTPADRVTTCERNWVRAKQVEDVAREKIEAGVFEITQYGPALFYRLGAELEWARARARQAMPTGETNRPLFDFLLADPLRDSAKGFARSHLEATQADPGDLARARPAVIRQGLEARFKQFAVGKKEATAEFLLWWLRRGMEAKLSLPLKRASRLAALEEFWLQAFETDRIATAKFDAGVFDITQYAPTRYTRLEAELRLAEARSKK